MMEMTKRHRASLEALRAECDYEDSRVGGDQNFVRWELLTNSHGAKTRAKLIEAGFAAAGQHRWSDAVGYRITEAGRAALAMPQPEKARVAPRLKQLEPILKSLKGRFDP